MDFGTIFKTLLLQTTSGKLLFYERVAEIQLLDTVTKTISEVHFKYFIRDQEVAIRRRSFT